MMDLDAAVGDGPARKRVATACEACRATKIRCQPSEQPGVCRKCLDSKRECISRSTPRPRRPRKYATPQDQELKQAQAAPPGPSSTFSIDFAVSMEPEIDDSFETLRESHQAAIGKLFPDHDGDGDAEDMSPFADSVRSFRTPTSSSQSHSIHDLHTKPSFNVASAESLLRSFHAMLRYFPCITLPEDTAIRQLAASRPFVLLAILSSTSGSKTLQGHTLYDEEFRKVLGLKFVAGGERTLELLQGILIYCAWYPFHLRPKNKQAFQYMRMAADMVHDLELDQEQSFSSTGSSPFLTDDQLDGIRAYLGYFYVVSTFLATWKRNKGIEMSYTPWTAKCCDILETHGGTHSDRLLATQARVAGILSQAARMMSPEHRKSDQDRRIMLAGFKSELQHVESSLPSSLSSLAHIKLQMLFIKTCLDGGALLNLFRAAPSECPRWERPTCTSAKLSDCVQNLALLYYELIALNDTEFSCFTLVDWSRTIVATILGIRLSFRIAEYPDWDSAAARSRLKMDEFLSHMSRQDSDLTPSSKKVDILSASRTVMAVVAEKYHRRVAALERERERDSKASAGITCPMLDGSMAAYLPVWDDAFGAPLMMDAVEGEDGQLVFQDLWTTMTMGWAQDEV